MTVQHANTISVYSYSDAFQKREKANEDWAIRQREKEKLLELKAKLAQQQAHLKQLSDHMYVFAACRNGGSHKTNDIRTATRSPRSRAASTIERRKACEYLTKTMEPRHVGIIENAFLHYDGLILKIIRAARNDGDSFSASNRALSPPSWQNELLYIYMTLCGMLQCNAFAMPEPI